MLSLRFWGVRGSIPCPGQNTLEFGGNTTCLEIRAGEKLLIIDFGTGIRALGDELVMKASKTKALDMDVFISHTHWDHIIGFPMFAPVFIPGSKIRIWGPVSLNGESLESIISGQMSYKYWPVRLDELAAEIEFRELKECSLDLGGGLKLTTKYLNHSIFCLGYRFEYQGKSIVSAFDHEPFRNIFSAEAGKPGFDEADIKRGEETAREENDKILSFYNNADLLVHDAQFLQEELENRLGWGHSSYDYAIDAALKAGVKKLVFFHHDPNRTDKQLKSIEKMYKTKLKNKPLEIIMAREGLKIEL